MRDPEMCFELGSAKHAHLDPFYWRNDYAGSEEWSRTIVDGNYLHMIALHIQQKRFAAQWDKNLNDQGFLIAFERAQTVPA
jgi:hypothetical protein